MLTEDKCVHVQAKINSMLLLLLSSQPLYSCLTLQVKVGDYYLAPVWLFPFQVYNAVSS